MSSIELPDAILDLPPGAMLSQIDLSSGYITNIDRIRDKEYPMLRGMVLFAP